jgi:hypothetical protein
MKLCQAFWHAFVAVGGGGGGGGGGSCFWSEAEQLHHLELLGRGWRPAEGEGVLGATGAQGLPGHPLREHLPRMHRIRRERERAVVEHRRAPLRDRSLERQLHYPCDHLDAPRELGGARRAVASSVAAQAHELRVGALER